MKISCKSSIILSKTLVVISALGIIGLLVCLLIGNNPASNIIKREVPDLVLLYSLSALLTVIGLASLCIVYRLLCNIQKELVFTEVNVAYLRAVSWSCIIAGAAVLSLLSQKIILLPILCSLVAVFIGVLLRVVKNAFEEAIRIKEENDLTV